jgi:hypothetical protein
MIDENDWLFDARSEDRDEQAIYTLRSTDRGQS